MSMEYGAFNTALTAAAGDDPALIAELRAAFIESATRQVDLLSRSRCDANWQYSCYRIKGLAASFGVSELIELADEAMAGAPGDPVIVRKLSTALKEIQLRD
ncbi:Hpt domain-containing protein [Sphingorhabdus pulchriflava]|jgi:HPt (histidine-containing phosphotransfer) domain-containing protein|uniref:Hpt domain-containing protein n=1 Tax=Sphingorhabdus pulchriflava TaxID=2292257 RepID=A0A371BH76_9SPHN|nr:Hpt domain-containing protein [Sphingorhabdus pulchriflava]MBK7163456.1 Hpt domain-containing protein [Sphingomonadales bacterium]RDV06945.1 Hpt domain-containing protein [Sphingorhabdus pulchriflava]